MSRSLPLPEVCLRNNDVKNVFVFFKCYVSPILKYIIHNQKHPNIHRTFCMLLWQWYLLGTNANPVAEIARPWRSPFKLSAEFLYNLSYDPSTTQNDKMISPEKNVSFRLSIFCGHRCCITSFEPLFSNQLNESPSSWLWLTGGDCMQNSSSADYFGANIRWYETGSFSFKCN